MERRVESREPEIGAANALAALLAETSPLFAPTGGPSELWMITCTGNFDGTSYADRLIVVAVPA